jgi:hypothetical protein
VHTGRRPGAWRRPASPSDQPAAGVQVVFMPFGSVSLWFFSTIENQHELLGCF